MLWGWEHVFVDIMDEFMDIMIMLGELYVDMDVMW